MRATVLVLIMIALAACSNSKSKQLEVVKRAPEDWTHESLLAAQRAGYTLVTRGGEQVLCRQDPQTGSRLQQTTTCMSLREWQRVRTTSRDTLDDLTRGQRPSCALENNC
jgi:hypothetical protein